MHRFRQWAGVWRGPGRDRGSVTLSAILGAGALAALAALAMGVMVVLIVGGAQLIDRNNQSSRIDVALTRMGEDIEFSKPMLYASPTHLVTRYGITKEVTGTGTDGCRYVDWQVTASGDLVRKSVDTTEVLCAGRYDAAAVWGHGGESSTVVAQRIVANVDGKPVFTYLTNQLQALDVSSPLTTTRETRPIAMVRMTLTAASRGDGRVSESSGQYLDGAPRGLSPAPSGTSSPAPAAPSVCAPGGKVRRGAGHTAIVTWTPDGNSYRIYRNGQQVGQTGSGSFTDTIPDGDWARVLHYQAIQDGASANAFDQGACVLWWMTRVDAPDLSGTVRPAASMVGGKPTVDWAAAGTDRPSFHLTWPAVVAARGYKVYGWQSGQWVLLNPDRDTDANLRSWDVGAAWGGTGRFMVKATGPTGDSDPSREVNLLAYPAAPVAGVKATGYGQNTITWKPVATATSYEVWRYADGQTTGARTLLGTTPDTTWVDKNAALGSTFTYVVVARNAAGNSPDSNRVSQLQYPPDPSVSGANTADHVNTVSWPAVRSATGYQVFSTWVNADRSTGLRHDVGNVTSWAETTVPASTMGVASTSRMTVVPATYQKGGATYRNAATGDVPLPLGSQRDYWVVALNATGASPNSQPTVNPGRKGITQRPAAPNFWLTYTPTLDNQWAGTAWSDTTQSGNPSGYRFCDTTAGAVGSGRTYCTFRPQYWNGSQWLDTGYLGDGTRDLGMAGRHLSGRTSQPWGASQRFRVLACNAGGCSDGSPEQTVNEYPGPFGVTRADSWAGFDFSTSNGISGAAQTTNILDWNGAAGAARYDWDARVNTGEHVWHTTMPWDPYNIGANGANNDAAVHPGPDRLTEYWVNARASNGLTRTIYWRTQSAPGTAQYMSAVWECNPSAGLWHVHYNEINTAPTFGNTDGTMLGVGSTTIPKWWSDLPWTNSNSLVNGAWDVNRDPNAGYWFGHAFIPQSGGVGNGETGAWGITPGSQARGVNGPDANNDLGQGRWAYAVNWRGNWSGSYTYNPLSTALALGVARLGSGSKAFAGCTGGGGWREVGNWGGNYPGGHPRQLWAREN